MIRLLYLPLAFGIIGSMGAANASAHFFGSDETTLREAKISAEGSALVEFLRNQALAPAELTQIRQAVQQLGDQSFSIREKAMVTLTTKGPKALHQVRQACKDPRLEVCRRAEECLESIQRSFNPEILAAVARMIVRKKPAGATEVLLNFLSSFPEDSFADEPRNALTLLAIRDDKADAVVLAALEDKNPARRAVAAEALGRSGASAVAGTLRKLLQDSEPMVRFHGALGLASRGDKEAIPVLIKMLTQLPREQAWQAEDCLLRLARDESPAVALKVEENYWSKSQEAWTAWWAEQGRKTTDSVLASPKVYGNTMMILLELNRIFEVDSDNKIRWQVEGLNFPLDAQLIHGARLLTAEYRGNRVTERNLRGGIVWEKQIQGPLTAQRLPNGNTFIATHDKLIEVDREGENVFSPLQPFQPGEQIMKAVKLPHNQIACLVSSPSANQPRFIRLDLAGKELQSFPIAQHNFSGGRLEVLPNGHVLVPHNLEDKVVEFNERGKPVWEVEVRAPIAAVRLANGNTLVTSMFKLNQRAVEFNPQGKEVWQYLTPSPEVRVTRAWRR